jgi:hypothetical protein
VVKPASAKVDSRIIFKRSTLSNQFLLAKILGKRPDTSLIISAANRGLDTSADFEYILSGDNIANLIIYKCQSASITNPSSPYTIPIALPLWT